MLMKDSAMSVAETEDLHQNQEISLSKGQARGQDENSSFENMQTELHSKGAVLTKAWSDLFSFITKYQAELVMKENSVEIAEKEIEERKRHLEEMKGVDAGDEENLHDAIRANERLLRKAQSELDVKDGMLQRVQSDLSSNMELLEISRCDLLKKQNDLVRYRGNVEQLKSELKIKQEQIQIKDNLLKKLQNQLMKENAELKEQLELERRALQLEKQSHDLTKRTMSSPQHSTRKRARTTATSSVIEIPDSPPTRDLSDDQDFGLSSIVSMAESRTESSEQGRRISSNTDHSSRLHHKPPASASSQISYAVPQKVAHFPKTFIGSTNDSVTVGETPDMTMSDTFFPLSVSEDTKADIDFLTGMKLDTDDQGDMPQPATPSSGASDNGSPLSVPGPIASPGMSPGGSIDGRADGKETSEFKGALFAALSLIGAGDGETQIGSISGSACATGAATSRGTSVVSMPVSLAATNANYSTRTHSNDSETEPAVKGKPGQKKFKCQFCEKTFKKRGEVINHARTHTGDKPFKCSFCSKAFAVEGKVRYHEMIHTGERPWTCSICGKKCISVTSLRYHLLTHKELTSGIDSAMKERQLTSVDGSTTKSIKCKICQKGVRGVGNYRKHLVWHEELAPVIHIMCSEQKMARKIQSQVSKEPLQCPECDKVFKKKYCLRDHLLIHTGELPFLCSICGKGYRTDVILKKHVQTHSDIKLPKTHPCPICNKAFKDITGLREHERIHTGEMPCTCHLCGKSFRFKSNLRAHLLTHQK